MKRPVLVGILLFAALVALIVYSTLGTAGHRVEVCMQFNGRTSCRTTAGASEEFAERTAVSNACSELGSGVTETLACERTPPLKVTILK